MRPRTGRREGVTLIELVVAVALGGLLLHLAVRSLLLASATERHVRRRADLLYVGRVARTVLREELRRGVEGRDWSPHPPDSIGVRSFAGAAVACRGEGPSDVVRVAWRGRRLPDPAKDSVLVLHRDGSWRALALLADATAAGDGCPPWPASAARSWRLSEPSDAPVVLGRVFERRTYLVSGDALRLRRGAGGRQPIAPEVLASGGALTWDSARLRLDLEERDGGWRWRGTLARRTP